MSSGFVIHGVSYPNFVFLAHRRAGTVDNLLLPENKQQLTDILLYHVVPGRVMAADVAGLDGKSADTALEGKQIAVKTDMGKVYL